ncbi:MAG: DNA-binding protein WhiA [Clostridia bacterium]|nr:DNA-binding protein WhiA [Clostridia bacterium]
MNFSGFVKNEIIEKGVSGKCCKKAFLAGFIRSSGSIIENDGEYGFMCETDIENAVGYALRLVKELYSFSNFNTYSYTDKLNKKDRLVIEAFGQNAIDILFDLGILTKDDTDGEEGFALRLKSNKELLSKQCCVRSFIKGMFVGGGQVTLPNENEKTATGYHLEVVFSHKVPAGEFAGHLASNNLFAKTISRKKQTVVYLKSAEEIKDFLALINVPKSVLKITDTMIVKQLSNNINRQKNCDLANVNKQIIANEKYLYAIEIIESTIGLSALSDDLIKTAEYKKEYFEDTLSELAQRLSITKSCLNHRLRKILSIAEELK